MGDRSGNPYWLDKPSRTTPMTAARLNAIEAALDLSVAKGENVVNVADYGAVGDGTTDDAAAINAAFAAGARVMLEAGKTYAINSGLTLSAAGAHIIGNGATIEAAASMGTALVISGTRALVEDLTVDGAGLVTSYGIDVAAGTAGVALRRVAVRGVNGSGTVALVRARQGCDNLTIEGCSLTDLATTGVGRGIMLNGTGAGVHGVKITRNTIANIERGEDGDGVVVQGFPGVVDVLIDGNTFRSCSKRAVKIENGGVMVSNNSILTPYNAARAGDGLYAHGYSAVSIYADGVTVTNNQITGSFYVAFVEIGASAAIRDVVISGNIFKADLTNRNTSQDGILVPATVAGAERITISGNVIHGARHGIRLRGALKKIGIIGNAIEDATGSAVVINDPTTAPEDVTVVGNQARNVANYYVHTETGIAPASLVFVGNAGAPSWGLYGGNAAAGSRLGFHGASPIAKQTVTGAKDGNAALGSLITALTNLGLIADTSS